MNCYTKDIVSEEDRAKMDREDYYTIANRAFARYGYDMENDKAYNGDEKYCKY